MKKLLLILTFVLTGAIFVVNTSCEDDPKEACEQDLFCDDTVEVTACCTDGANCYYTYNGINYPDTDQGLLDLIEALDCSTKSVSIDGDDYMVVRLQALLEEARKLSKQ
ncbi:hypothetical protein ACFLSE_00925 [Bacteroidota bacterium]